MDFSTQEWLTVLIVILIVGILLDGFRRMRNSRRDSLGMSLNLKTKGNNQAEDIDDSLIDDVDDENYGSEFPNGGARVSSAAIDEERIAQARSKYDFGADLSRLTRGFNQAVDKSPKRIEPTLDNDDEQLPEQEYIAEGDVLLRPKNNLSDNDDASSGNTLDEQGIEESNIEERAVEGQDIEQDANIEPEQSSSTEAVVDTVEEQSEALVSTPEQVQLNLDDSVPMLMETTDTVVASGVDKVEASTKDSQQPRSDQDGIRSVAKNIALENQSPDSELKKYSANKPSYTPTSGQEKKSSLPEEVLVIHVKANEGGVFYGNDLLELILENGLRYGAMDIFHRHADEEGEGPILFSMANMVMPGVFDLQTFESFSTIGVSFFLTLPTSDDKNMVAFDIMLLTAKNIAKALGGELKDEQRSVMTSQTAEHYRERIRDFARRQQLEKNKI